MQAELDWNANVPQNNLLWCKKCLLNVKLRKQLPDLEVVTILPVMHTAYGFMTVFADNPELTKREGTKDLKMKQQVNANMQLMSDRLRWAIAKRNRKCKRHVCAATRNWHKTESWWQFDVELKMIWTYTIINSANISFPTKPAKTMWHIQLSA